MNRAEKEIQDEIQSARNFLALHEIRIFTDTELPDYILKFISDNLQNLNYFFTTKFNQKVRIQKVLKKLRRGDHAFSDKYDNDVFRFCLIDKKFVTFRDLKLNQIIKVIKFIKPETFKRVR